MRRSVIVAGVIFALLVITQVQASAQTGVVYGCVNNRNGALRIVSGPKECGSKETAISWNQAGTQGPPGAPGTACWDLNANSVCDSNEDKNGDSYCDALDCQAPPGAGPLGVYDGNNLYLGHLVNFNDPVEVIVLNPDIPGYFVVIATGSPYIRLTTFSHLGFSSAGCTGQTYIGLNHSPFGILYDPYSGKHYVADTSLPTVVQNPPQSNVVISARVMNSGECQGWASTGEYMAVKELTSFPFAGVTLAYPITIRPIQ